MLPKKTLLASSKSKFKLKRISFSAGQIIFLVLLLGAIITSILAFMTGQMTFPTIFAGLSSTIGIAATVLSVYSFFVPERPTTTSNIPLTSVGSGSTGANLVPMSLTATQSEGTLLTGNTASKSPNDIQGGNLTQSLGLPIFFTTPLLSDKNEFYGRNAARHRLITHITNGGSCSIVGKQNLGKTWLLKYLRLTLPTYNDSNRAYNIGYIVSPYLSWEDFVQQALEQFDPSLSSNNLDSLSLNRLAQCVRDFKKKRITPVLCIDEFEGLNHNKQTFNGEFFEGLRAMTQRDGLVLVTASESPLKELIRDRTGMTAPLFSVTQPIFLDPFTKREAEDFVHDKSNKAKFTKKERDFFLSLTFPNEDGEPSWPPLYLQLAGQLLHSAKQDMPEQSLDGELDDLGYQREFKRHLYRDYQAMMRDKS